MIQTKTQQLNPQIFTIWSDEIEGRIDPYFYRSEFKELNKILANIKTVKFTELINSISMGASIPKYKEEKNEVPFVFGKNVKHGFLDLNNLEYISQETCQKFKSSILKKNDLVFSVRGAYIGKVAKIPKELKDGNIINNLVRINLKDEKLADYLTIYLSSKIGQALINREVWGGAQPGVTNEQIKNLQIPIPPLPIQNKIVAIMSKAYEKKKEKGKEAEKLLELIDDYVLNELKIRMPKIKNKMFFTVYSDEIEGRRIDPKAYLEMPKEIIKAIKKSKYKSKKLSDIIIESIAGEWGEDPIFTDRTNDYVLVNVLRNTNFDNRFNLNFENVAQRLITKDKFKKVKLQKDDILIEKSGGSPIQPVGRVAIFENNNENYAFSNFLQCFRINKQECLPYYLFAYLKTIYNLGYMEYVQNQTTGIKNLIMKEYLSIPVLLPPITIQKKIAKKIELYYSQSKTLQKEAKENLEKAKRKVEEEIEKEAGE